MGSVPRPLVQPNEIGPFTFGNAVAVHSGNRACPGAFSITAIWNAEEQTEEIGAFSRDTALSMLGMEGFIGVTLTRIGTVGVTISAWEKPENVNQIVRGGKHGEAMQRFWAELGNAGFTSVWTPHHINPFWVRCMACNKMVDYEKQTGTCPCGQALPERPPYF